MFYESNNLISFHYRMENHEKSKQHLQKLKKMKDVIIKENPNIENEIEE